ncbi:hypothetical protein GCM10009847_17010 [Leucobacter tardus]|uniref:Uncharacterized protein n=1 Tax=Leucobacter tardus TaxID=501483 RepID=A0A939QGG3_9MICO|nr:hypothetical protein [Leucobacter tardus]MBO2990783.1 hypothetical protein [Leucobacter tardus]
MGFTITRGRRGRNRLRFSLGRGRRRTALSSRVGPFSLSARGKRRATSNRSTRRRRWF